MRRSTWAVFLFVSLKGIASVSTALATPAAEPEQTVVRPATAVDRLSSDQQQPQPAVRTDNHGKTETSGAKPLSNDLASPKPVQIYWFFGGR